MNKAYKKCQSCGMPLKRDEQGGGTNADGSKSAMYCSHCYQRGQFVLPDISVEQMQTRVQQKLAEMGLPRFLAGFFTKGIPKLERWQQHPEAALSLLQTSESLSTREIENVNQPRYEC